MYLKRLDLHGFKSFASRTRFEFGQGITAIVGPNGSGKSNIADALRWVLGEQSGRLLRAKRLDDILYAGSGKKAPADKIDVTMTLDNSDGWLAVDVPEVTISRRGSRSSDGEYQISGKRIRLRELQTLLATANVGQNSYAIIGQGLVESVLNLRADERRQLIEEAADIQRYRLKIEEAGERLKSTHENTARIRLLIKEIAPRLAQLERQAKRAGEHAQLSRELMQALRVFYEERWHSAQEQLTVARAGHDQMQAEFTQARVALETCQRELDDITSRLDEQRQAASAALAERDRLDQRLRDLERRLAVTGERGKILHARQKEMSEELSVIEEEQARLAAIARADESNRGQLAKMVSDARTEWEARQAELSELERDFREAHVHAADAEAKARRLQSAAAEVKTRIRRLEEAGRDMERQASRFETRRRSLISQMTEHVRVLRGVRAQDVQLLGEVASTAARRQALEAEVEQARESLEKLEAIQNGRRGKLEGLEARLSVLSDAQQQAQAAQPREEASLEGALTAVYEIIRVPREMEEAVSAALAEQLEAFVYEHETEALLALQALVDRGGPRTSVLPMDAIKQVYPLHVMREKGVVGVASELVKYVPKYEKLVNLLLGRTIVVQDAATGRRLAKRRIGTIVTLDGVVFHPSGHISGGQPRTTRPFVLGYERDLEAIPKEIDRIQKSLAIAGREADSLRDRLRQAEKSLASLTREAEEGLDKRVKLQDSISMRQQKMAQLRGELRGLIGSQVSLRQQQASYQQDVERMSQERDTMLEEAKEASDTARHVGTADKLFKDRRNVQLKAVSEAADALARVDGELRSLTVQKENAEASLARLEAQASAKTVQLRGLEMELATLRTSMDADQKEMSHARAELDALMERVQPGAEGAHHLEARQRDLHSQVLSCQNRMFEGERRLLETEAQVRRWETEIENLRNRIAEDGLALTPAGDIQGEAAPPAVPYWLAAEGSDEGPGGLRPISGGARADPENLAREIESLRARVRALGPVNIEAAVDYESLRERHDFLAGHVTDLEAAEQSLQRAIVELTALMQRRFETTFQQVAEGFERNFQMFFGGGHARLSLTDPKDTSSSGIEIEARPPGKRTRSLAQLSGGEKSLTAVALLFALLQANPAPFCVLDEVDAMLDEANVDRFASALKDLAERTQFIVITHNRRTIEMADSIYGVSMGPDATSRVLSMRLADVATAN